MAAEDCCKVYIAGDKRGVFSPLSVAPLSALTFINISPYAACLIEECHSSHLNPARVICCAPSPPLPRSPLAGTYDGPLVAGKGIIPVMQGRKAVKATVCTDFRNGAEGLRAFADSMYALTW